MGGAVLAVVCAALVGAAAAVAQGREPRLHHLQMLGTHNSYHHGCWVNGTLADIAVDMACGDALQLYGDLLEQYSQSVFGYSYDEIMELYQSATVDMPTVFSQLEVFGVRMLEFDVHFDGVRYGGGNTRFPVYHRKTVDTRSHCGSLAQCLRQVRHWSTHHASHLPVLVHIEIKAASGAEAAGGEEGVDVDADELVAELNSEILAVFSSQSIVTPMFVVQSAQESSGKAGNDDSNEFSVASALASVGWPPLSQCVNKVMFVVEGDSAVEAYDPTQHVFFVDSNGDTGQSYSAIHLLQNVNEDALALNQLVAIWNSNSEAAAKDGAFNGAHYFKTDFPELEAFDALRPATCNPYTDTDELCASGLTSLSDVAQYDWQRLSECRSSDSALRSCYEETGHDGGLSTAALVGIGLAGIATLSAVTWYCKTKRRRRAGERARLVTGS